MISKKNLKKIQNKREKELHERKQKKRLSDEEIWKTFGRD